MTIPDLQALPGIVLDRNEPVFAEPWEAQAFAMVINLHQSDFFTWEEWATELSAQIHSGRNHDYYAHWLAALESIVAAKSLTCAAELASRKDEWKRAASETPHGEPIVLSAALSSRSQNI